MAYCGPRGIPLSTFLGWAAADQDAALAWQTHDAARCQQCGTHPDEWAENRHAYHAHMTRCRGCEERERLAAAPTADGRGLHVRLAHGGPGSCQQCNPDPVRR